MDMRDLYQEMILEHYKKPRNYRVLENADRVVEGYNPLCGDHYTIYVDLDGETIDEITFQGTGCAISKASASVMSDALKGKSREEAEALFEMFRKMVTGEATGDAAETMGKLAAFQGVAEHPSRVKCAILSWRAVRNAIEGGDGVATTE